MHFTPSTRPKLKRRSPEHDMQVSLFKWASLAGKADSRLAMLFAIPNGGHRDARTAARLRAEGVKRGVPDVFLAVPVGKYHGLWLELKAGKNTPSEDQNLWLASLEFQGYACRVVYDDWSKASDIIAAYLAGKLG